MERQSLILIAEDDPSVRSVLARSLQREGFLIADAPDGQAALEVFEKLPEKPDLLLTDVAMPRMSGPDLAARVLVAHPDQKVAFVTAYAAEHAVKMMTTGFPVLPKPFTHEQLVQFVRKSMGNAAVPA